MVNRTVLVVDDEEGIRETLRQALSSRVPNVCVMTAASGDEALSIMQQEPVDLVVSDYKMPGITGIEFLTRARSLSPRAPRIMMTAFADEKIAIDAINSARVDRFLQKPFEIGEAIKVVGDLLASAHAESQRQVAFARSLETLRLKANAVGLDAADG